jgi:hypothetical protein
VGHRELRNLLALAGGHDRLEPQGDAVAELEAREDEFSVDRHEESLQGQEQSPDRAGVTAL